MDICLWIFVTILPLIVLAAQEDDYKFMELYGKEQFASGVWETIEQYRYAKDKLANIAAQVHKLAGKRESEVITAFVDSGWLEFYEPENNPDMHVDLLVYEVKGVVLKGTKEPYRYYVTKGLKPDCVYYVKRIHGTDDTQWSFNLDKHICGVVM